MPTLYFDFVDPLSYLLELELREAAGGDVEPPERIAWELRPPPAPLVLQDDPTLAARWSEGRRLAEQRGIVFAPPRLVPWSRKAHELHRFAATHDVAEAVRLAVFEAYLLHGRDIGRVDVLVELAGGEGLDRTETKAVLDVDRHEAEVASARTTAERLGVSDAPVLVRGGARLEGFHNRTTLRTFLRASSGGDG